MLILNRHLTSADVPLLRVAELDPPSGIMSVSNTPAGWATLGRFARTFELALYMKDAAQQIDEEANLNNARQALAAGSLHRLTLTELRSALATAYWLYGYGLSFGRDEALLADGLLDAIYAHVSGGARRPVGDPGPIEPEIGTPNPASKGAAQRFWFAARNPSWSREELYDRVAGLLMRTLDVNRFALGCLYLYPPGYSHEDATMPPTHTFFVSCLPAHGNDSEVAADELDRVTRVVVAALGDATLDCYPPPDADRESGALGRDGERA